MAKLSNEMKQWAAIGAQARIVELQAEIERVRTAFPALRQDGGASAESQRGKSAPSSLRKRKRTMSAEARKRIGDAQRKRWAERRQKHKSGEAPTPTAGKQVSRKAGRRRAERREVR